MMEIKKIILHTDWEHMYAENRLSASSTIHVPTLIGKTQSLIPKGFELSRRVEKIVRHPLFNDSNLADINLTLGQHGLYLLILRNMTMLKEASTYPKSLVHTLYINANNEPDYKGFIYSFYNNTNSPNIRITAKLVPMNLKDFSSLQANGNSLSVRLFLMDAMRLKLPKSLDLHMKMTITEGTDKNGQLNWTVGIKEWSHSGTSRESNDTFSNTIPMFCIVLLTHLSSNGQAIKTDELYKLATKFTFSNSNSLNAQRNIISAFSSFLTKKASYSNDKKYIIDIFQKIYTNSISIGRIESTLQQLKKIEIEVISTSLTRLLSA